MVMVGKLFKMVDGYTLSITGDYDDTFAITNHKLAMDHEFHKLDISNCELIDYGFDISELKQTSLETNKKTYGVFYNRGYLNGFEKGFKKAIMSERKNSISEREVESNFQGLGNVIEDKDIYNFYIDLIKSMICKKRNSWEVSIKIDRNKNVILDNNGCLILEKPY